MKTMEDYVEVRRMREIEGLGLREISRRTGWHRGTIRKILKESAPPGYQRKGQPRRPVLGPFVEIIDQMLREDAGAPRKQRHTERRIWQRLREKHGYRGCSTQPSEYIKARKGRAQEAFVPPAFARCIIYDNLRSARRGSGRLPVARPVAPNRRRCWGVTPAGLRPPCATPRAPKIGETGLVILN